MKEYLQDNMKDEIEVQEAKEKDVNSIFFEIQKLGHIVFAENSSTPQYRTGLFYIPKSISDKQRQALKEFIPDLIKEDYHIVELINLYRAEDGILMGEQRQGKADILKNLIELEVER